MTIIHVISYSSGKDSDETLRQCIACETRRLLRMSIAPTPALLAERIRVVICDTGNESDHVWEHVAYIEQRFGIKAEVLRADFSAELAAKRMFIARDVRTRRQYRKGPKVDRNGKPVWKRDRAGNVLMVPVACSDDDSSDCGGGTATLMPVQAVGYDSGRKVRWTNKAKRRALAAMHPSGNPFLDLCMWKGRFPSRKAQFCTQELKTAMLVQYQQELVEAGYGVVSWQGVRRDESPNRRGAKRCERLQPHTFAYRPLVEWTAIQVFASLAAHDIEVNALYRQGMGRVGCFPCINIGKAELREIAVRWPEEIDRIAEWERRVGDCSKRGFSTFMADAHQAKDRRVIFAELNIRARVEWSKTTRGGKQFDLLASSEPAACVSSYGLCE